MVVLFQTKKVSSVWAETGILSPTLTIRWWYLVLAVENSGLVYVYVLFTQFSSRLRKRHTFLML